jgi:hypothetical protein
MTAHDYQFRWAFSNTKQTAYGTPTADGSLLKGAFVSGPNLVQRKPMVIPNSSMFGLGHEFSNDQAIDAWDIDLSLDFDLSSVLAGICCGFGLGTVNTTTPIGGVFQHVFKPLDPATALQLPAMSIVEEPINNTGVKKKIQDLIVASWEVSGAGKERLKLSAKLKGSGQWANSSLSMPAITAAKFWRMADCKFELGVFGGALTDVSSRVRGFKVGWDNGNANDVDGYFPGSPRDGTTLAQFRGRHEIGQRRSPSFSLDLLQDVDGTELDRLDAGTNLAFRVTATGPVISGVHNYTFIADVPDIRYKIVEKKYLDGKLGYGIDSEVHYDDVNLCPIFVTLKNDQSAYL